MQGFKFLAGEADTVSKAREPIQKQEEHISSSQRADKSTVAGVLPSQSDESARSITMSLSAWIGGPSVTKGAIVSVVIASRWIVDRYTRQYVL